MKIQQLDRLLVLHAMHPVILVCISFCSGHVCCTSTKALTQSCHDSHCNLRQRSACQITMCMPSEAVDHRLLTRVKSKHSSASMRASLQLPSLSGVPFWCCAFVPKTQRLEPGRPRAKMFAKRKSCGQTLCIQLPRQQVLSPLAADQHAGHLSTCSPDVWQHSEGTCMMECANSCQRQALVWSVDHTCFWLTSRTNAGRILSQTVATGQPEFWAAYTSRSLPTWWWLRRLRPF